MQDAEGSRTERRKYWKYAENIKSNRVTKQRQKETRRRKPKGKKAIILGISLKDGKTAVKQSKGKEKEWVPPNGEVEGILE